MKEGILICGLNGAGKSTIAKQLAIHLNYTYLDVEDFYFPVKNDYKNIRSKQEMEAHLLGAIQETQPFILASVIGDFNEEILSYITEIIYIEVPKDIRIERMKQRSINQFGPRALPGGDLYEDEMKFVERMANRDEKMVENWLLSMNCNIITIDGSDTIEQNLAKLLDVLK